MTALASPSPLGPDREELLARLRVALAGPGVAFPPHPQRRMPRGPAETVSALARALAARGRSANTIRQYSFFTRALLQWIGKPLDGVSPSDLENYLEYLAVERRYSKTSLYLTVRALASLFRTFGLTTADQLEPPHRSVRVPRYLSEPETRRLLRAPGALPRDRALLYVLCLSGLRVSEACALEVGDLGFADGILHVRAGKGDKDRELPLDGGLAEVLREYLRSRGPVSSADRVFPFGVGTAERIVAQAGTSAGISHRVSPHQLRHTYATTLLRRGVDLRIIKELLGHSSVAVTEIYASVDRGAIRDAVRKAGALY